MKPLLKIMASLFIVFASTFFILNTTGFITVAKIEFWLLAAKNADPLLIAPVVAFLLFTDLVFSIPTFATLALGGYFLGPVVGAMTGTVGLAMTGVGGYAISRRYGDRLMHFLINDEVKRSEAIETFNAHGAIVILLSRSVPMLPEVSACMAGMARMRFMYFLALWLGNCVPYAVIAAYAGSVSTFDDPRAAIFTAIGVWSFLGLLWLLLRRAGNRRKQEASP